MKRIVATHWVIHSLAILHAAASAFLLFNGMGDSVVLTVLTIVLFIVLARIYAYPMDLAATLALLGCFIGFFFGTQGGRWLARQEIIPFFWSGALVTFLVTELLGWVMWLIVAFRRSDRSRKAEALPVGNSLWQVVMLSAIVIALRLLYVNLYLSLRWKYDFLLSDFLLDTVRHTTLLLVMVALDLLFVSRLGKWFGYGRRPLGRLVVMVCYLLLISFLGALLLNIDYLRFDRFDSRVVFAYIQLYFMAVLLINMVFTVGADLFYYATSEQKQALSRAIETKNRVKYRYSQLKQQLNPHFLFNSLNMLDYLVHIDPERASEFIRKLAGVYRYLLSTEQDRTVFLSQELRFARAYVELLKERFTDGLAVFFEVDREHLSCRVIPCSLQLLIENATKHNVVNKERVLTIRISVEREELVVWNNLQPRVGRRTSFGIGLSNISAQYMDMTGRAITIEKGADHFTVRLPLMR